MTGTVVASRVRSIHPFPARMAPDLALQKIEALTSDGDTVLDPMCGSGTVVATAQSSGRRALACDLDPLAVMITRTACSARSAEKLRRRAERLVDRAMTTSSELPPWIANDEQTRNFVEFWFAEPQRRALSQLARVLGMTGGADDPLRIALSRLIVTKDRGASLARDTSHSRPHKVRHTNDFDVMGELPLSAGRIEQLMTSAKRDPRASVRLSDARSLRPVSANSVDLVATSPPYLNAIDYLRGHRLSLVWFGYTLSELRETRGTSIGTERGLSLQAGWKGELLQEATSDMAGLSSRQLRMTTQYITDMAKVARSAHRVLRPGGHLVFVVANSTLGGTSVDNSVICRETAKRAGLKYVGTEVREIPAAHRYLPPPRAGSSTSLDSRMKLEHVITLQKSAMLPMSR